MISPVCAAKEKKPPANVGDYGREKLEQKSPITEGKGEMDGFVHCHKTHGGGNVPWGLSDLGKKSWEKVLPEGKNLLARPRGGGKFRHQGGGGQTPLVRRQRSWRFGKKKTAAEKK